MEMVVLSAKTGLKATPGRTASSPFPQAIPHEPGTFPTQSFSEPAGSGGDGRLFARGR